MNLPCPAAWAILEEVRSCLVVTTKILPELKLGGGAARPDPRFETRVQGPAAVGGPPKKPPGVH